MGDLEISHPPRSRVCTWIEDDRDLAGIVEDGRSWWWWPELHGVARRRWPRHDGEATVAGAVERRSPASEVRSGGGVGGGGRRKRAAERGTGAGAGGQGLARDPGPAGRIWVPRPAAGGAVAEATWRWMIGCGRRLF